MQIKRKTVMAFVSTIIALIGMVGLLLLFFTHFVGKGVDAVGTDMRSGEAGMFEGVP